MRVTPSLSCYVLHITFTTTNNGRPTAQPQSPPPPPPPSTIPFIQPQHSTTNTTSITPHANNNRQSANKQNFLSTTLGNLECLIEHTTNAEESLYLEGEGGRSKSKTLRMDGSSFSIIGHSNPPTNKTSSRPPWEILCT